MLEFVIYDWKCSGTHQIMLVTKGATHCVTWFAGKMSCLVRYSRKNVHKHRVGLGVGAIDKPEHAQELANLRQTQVHHLTQYRWVKSWLLPRCTPSQ